MRRRDIVPYVNLSSRRRWAVSLTLRQLQSEKPLDHRRLGQPQSRYGRFGEDKIPLPCRESNRDSSIVNLVSTVHYTKWATRQRKEIYAYTPLTIFSFNKNHERTKFLQDYRMARPKVAFEQLRLLLRIPQVVRWHTSLGTNYTDGDFSTIILRPSKCQESASN